MTATAATPLLRASLKADEYPPVGLEVWTRMGKRCAGVNGSGNESCAGWASSTGAAGLANGIGLGGRGQELLPALLAAKVEGLAFTFGLERGGGVHGHAADGVLGG